MSPGLSGRFASGVPLLIVVAVLFFGIHLAFLAPAPDSVDSTNFALGVVEFDVGAHRPHPPGSPLFIGLGRLAQSVQNRFAGPPVGPGGDTARAARGLSWWSAWFGALTIFPVFALFRSVDRAAAVPLATALLTLACPLVWLTSVRPMSDLPGLCLALAVQALAVGAWMRLGDHDVTQPVSPDGHADLEGRLALAAALSGAAIGVRSQTLWLTLPMLSAVLVAASRRSPRPWRVLTLAAAAFGLGIALWVPALIAASGGVGSYLELLRRQALDDVNSSGMLVTAPSIRRAMEGLASTFVLPWRHEVPGGIVIALALAGLVVTGRRSPRTLAVIGVLFLPYACFHLLFQDTSFVRYAIPLVPPTAFLAVKGVAWMAPRALMPVTVAFAVVLVQACWATLAAYSDAPSPVLRALRDLTARATTVRPTPVLAMHYGVAMALRGEEVPVPRLESSIAGEWIAAGEYWLRGGEAPVWFLARWRRTDLASIDPASRRLIQSYRWPFDRTAFLGGAPPGGVDWWEISDPGWFVMEGWGLTPETSGVAMRAGRGPESAPIAAYIRRRTDRTMMLIGSRNLDAGRSAKLRVTLDGTSLDSWRVGPGAAQRWIELPPGRLSGAGRYARLEVSAEGLDATAPAPKVIITQFDVQSPGRAMVGFEQGWHRAEYDAGLGQLWRWMAGSAALRIVTFGSDVELRLRGEAPVEQLGRPSHVTVRAGAREIATFMAAGEFDLRVRAGKADLAESGGRITINADRAFVPAEEGMSTDTRELALRVLEASARVID